MSRDKAIIKLRELLVMRREALKKALQGDFSLLQELAEQTEGDEVDFAMESAHHEISSQLAAAQSQELNLIADALKSMKDGTYGLCEACNQPIAMPRLEALPYASLCIEHAREAEEAVARGDFSGSWDRVPDLNVADSDVTLNDMEFYEA